MLVFSSSFSVPRLIPDLPSILEVNYVQIWRLGLLVDRVKNYLTVLYDLKEIIQQWYHQKLFSVPIPALVNPEPRCILYAFPWPLISIFLKEYMHMPPPLLSTLTKA